MLVLVFILTGLQVSANSNGFKDKEGIFSKNLEEIYENTNSGSLAYKNTYPFSEKDAKISQVGFDVLYGVSKDIVRYVGEIPYSNTHDANGNAFAGMSQLPYDKNNPAIDNEDYWGKTGLENKELTKSALEAVNDQEVVSLRLFALSNVGGAMIISGFYSFFSFIVRIESMISGILLQLKNINITTIMSALQLDKVNDLLVKLFIVSDGANGGKRLAPAMIFALIALGISIVTTLLSIIFGGKKGKDLFSDVIAVALLGFILVGVAFTGHTVDVGSNVANITNQFLVSVNPSMQDNNIFDTQMSGGDTNRTNALVEMSSINKAYINAQICAQFGVDDISELSFEKLGDKDGQLATQYLDGYNDKDQTTVDKNLGYYYWFANSSAKSLNKSEIPVASETQTKKLSSMMTYLQVLYNRGNDEVKGTIRDITLAFARPSVFNGIVNMILLGLVFFGLVWCLGKYALRVAVSKMSIMLGVLALPIAGILTLTTNKKARELGKGLLGIFITATLKVTIFSIFFDLIIFGVSILVSGNVVLLVIACVFLAIMSKLNPVIEKSLDDMLRGFERQFSPEAAKLKSDAKVWARQRLHKISEDGNRGSKKVVGYTDDGTPIFAKQTSGIATTVAETLENMLQENPINSRSNISIFKKGFTRIKSNADSRDKALRGYDVKTTSDEISELEKGIADKALTDMNAAFDEKTNTAKYDLMAQDEINLYKKLKSAEAIEETTQRTFKAYNDRKEDLTADEETERQKLAQEINQRALDTANAKKNLTDLMMNNRKISLQNQEKEKLQENYQKLLESIDKKDSSKVANRMLVEKKLWALNNNQVADTQTLTAKDMELIDKQSKAIEYNSNRTASGKLVDRAMTKDGVAHKTDAEMYKSVLEEAKQNWGRENGLDKSAKPTFSFAVDEPKEKTELEKTREMFSKHPLGE